MAGRGGTSAHTVSEGSRIRFSTLLEGLREDDEAEFIDFPPDLDNIERKFLHELARDLGLESKSTGKGEKRFIRVSKRRKKDADLESVLALTVSDTATKALDRHFQQCPVTGEEMERLYAEAARAEAERHAVRTADEAPVETLELPPPPQVRRRRKRPYKTQSAVATRGVYYETAQLARKSHPDYGRLQAARQQLPAWAFRETVCDLVLRHQVVMVSGGTGCGKSTQVPQFLLDDPRIGEGCSMVVTQPRRISAIGVGERVAEERSEEIGQTVGYAVRMDVKTSDQTQILFLTPGVLLRRLGSDPSLGSTTHVVIDEVHERDSNTEFLLIALRDLLPKRPDLRLVLMSATLQTERFVEYFAGCPIVTIGSSSFPVEEFFLEDALEHTDFMASRTFRDREKKGGGYSEASARELQKLRDGDMSRGLECSMCGRGGFKSVTELGTHVALCTGAPAAPKAKKASSKAAKAAKAAKAPPPKQEPARSAGMMWLERDGEDEAAAPDAPQDALGGLDALSALLSADDAFAVDDYTLNAAGGGGGGGRSSGKKSKSFLSAAGGAGDGPEDAEGGAADGGALGAEEGGEDEGEMQALAEEAADNFGVLEAEGAMAFGALDGGVAGGNESVGGVDSALLQRYQYSHDDEEVDVDLVVAVLDYLMGSSYEKGAVLVFLPGWHDISTLSETLRAHECYGDERRFKILPLHSGVPTQKQREVFRPPGQGRTKLILSTNIAETSITVPDVAFVINSGKVKEKSYDPHLKTSTLDTKWATRASCQQRRGRAGRVRSGVCYHLFSRRRHTAMRSHVASELLRTPLEELVLQAKALGLATGPRGSADGVRAFLQRAVDAPHPKAVEHAISVLEDLKCLDGSANEALTALGATLAALPMHPLLGRMVLWAALLGCADEALAVAASASTRAPFVLPAQSSQRAPAKAAKRLLAGGFGASDHLALLGVQEGVRACGGHKALQKFCDQHFLSLSAVQTAKRSADSLRNDLSRMGFADRCGARERLPGGRRGARALFVGVLGAGLYPNAARRAEGLVSFSCSPRTADGRKVRPSQRSLVAKRGAKDGKCTAKEEVVVFGELTRQSGRGTFYGPSLQIDQVTLVPPLPLLLLAGTLRVLELPEELLDEGLLDGSAAGRGARERSVMLEMDGWLRYTVSRTMALHLQVLRHRLAIAFDRVVDRPRDRLRGTLQQAVLAASAMLHAEGQAVIGDAQRSKSAPRQGSRSNSTPRHASNPRHGRSGKR